MVGPGLGSLRGGCRDDPAGVARLAWQSDPHGLSARAVFRPWRVLDRLEWSADFVLRRLDPNLRAADDLQLLMSNHSVPATDEGHATAYRNVIPLGITLHLGGHGSYFENCGEIYAASPEKIEQTTAHLLTLFGNRSPDEIFLSEKVPEYG